MIRSLSLLFSILLISFSSFGQQKKVARPDLPGSFIIDFGFNQPQNKPSGFSPKFIGSHSVNLYYQYPIRFGKSKFSFNPGIGFSFERFKFKTTTQTLTGVKAPYYNTLLESKTEAGVYEMHPHYTVSQTAISGGSRIDTTYTHVKKSQLVNNYVEIPLEFRFDTAPEDISHSFNIALGARFGYLYDSFTKLKYTEDGDTKKLKDKQKHGMNTYRYGVYTRIGVGGFNIFGFYNLTPMFEKDKGPGKTTMNTFTVGISINGF